MTWTALLVAFVFLAGHAFLWISAVNILHGTAVARPWRGLLTLAGYGWLCAGPIVFLGWCLLAPPVEYRWATLSAAERVGAAYLALCGLVAAGPLPVWLVRAITSRPSDALVESRETLHNECDEFRCASATAFQRALLSLPGNECRRLTTTEKTLLVPKLPAELEGLTIAHVSDLHLTGALAKEYYLRAMDMVNAMSADLIALTGDYIDRGAYCDWLPDILAQLQAPHGVYAIIGNHDVKFGARRVRELLQAASVVDLGLGAQEVTIRGTRVALVGNEAPWIRPVKEANIAGADQLFRVLLSHSPDQLGWAAKRDYDLVLAGHTHGGQIVLPLIGPIVAPSIYGVRYAAGVFKRGATVMHVSRGMGGETPVRYRCPPEITRLTLTRALNRPAR